MNKSKVLALIALFSCVTVLAQAAGNHLPGNLAIESVDGNRMEDILVDGLYVKNTIRYPGRDYPMDGLIRIEEDDSGQQIILRKNVTGIDLKVEPKLVKTVE